MPALANWLTDMMLKNMKYGPMSLQIFTTHSLFSCLSIRKQLNDNKSRVPIFKQLGTQLYDIRASHPKQCVGDK